MRLSNGPQDDPKKLFIILNMRCNKLPYVLNYLFLAKPRFITPPLTAPIANFLKGGQGGF